MIVISVKRIAPQRYIAIANTTYLDDKWLRDLFVID